MRFICYTVSHFLSLCIGFRSSTLINLFCFLLRGQPPDTPRQGSSAAPDVFKRKAKHDADAHGAMVAGTSAGAAVMSLVMITGNELKHPDYASTFRNIEADNIETKTGLGMLRTAIIDQHFVKRSRHNRLISAVIEYPEMLCIGIDESTAILVRNNKAEVIGESQVLVYSNPMKSKKVKDGKLGAQGLQLDIYLPGNTFEIDE